MTAVLPLPTGENVCAVVVTYFPDADFAGRARRILSQVARVVIVDNGSTGPSRERLESMRAEARVEIIKLPTNLGLGTALNRGVERAVECGYSFALTLDQDSVPYEGMVSGLSRVYRESGDPEHVAVVGANYDEMGTGTTALRIRAEPRGSFMEVDEVITSGSMMSLAAFRHIGRFREDFFIYYVDHEYCARARSAGYRVLLARDRLMQHETGKATRRKILWREVVTPNYPPWRNYYIVRNGLILAREHFHDDPRWASFRVWVLAKRGVATMLLEEDRLAKLRYILLGARDGLLRRTGRRVS